MIHKPIYKPKARAREYGDLATNIYNGCPHGCTYCYARAMKKRFTPKGAICTFDTPEPRPYIVQSITRQIERERIAGKLIHLCFSCDPYPAGIDTIPTRAIIEIIKASGNNVQILTKGGQRAERDFDLLGAGDLFGATITGLWNHAEQYEPGAASNQSRIDALKAAHGRGVKTWLSCEPVIDTTAIYSLIKNAHYIDLFRIGKMNNHPSGINWATFGAKCVELCKEYGRAYYIKDDLQNEMRKGGYQGEI